MTVFLPVRGGVTIGTVTPTEIPYVSDNGNIMRVRAVLKTLAMAWDSRQTVLLWHSLCSQDRAYGPGAKGEVTPTENLED